MNTKIDNNRNHNLWAVLLMMALTTASTAQTVNWAQNRVLGPNNPTYFFAGIYQFDNLTLGDGVEVTSSNISHLIIKVNGTLTLGKNAVIRVRNGFYPEWPVPLSTLTAQNLSTIGVDAGGVRLYPEMFGKGGDGGSGMSPTGCASAPGDGGGGGFGGGQSQDFTGMIPGECCGLGGNGANGSQWMGGGGGGGNGGGGGAGGNVVWQTNGNFTCESMCFSECMSAPDPTGCIAACQARCYPPCGVTGGGGGGGGYGGGILTIIAQEIRFDSQAPPKFLVSGQRGGAPNGQNGEGGMLIIQAPNYASSPTHWELGNATYGTHSLPSVNGGHGIVTGNPQKVFLPVSNTNTPPVLAAIPDQAVDAGQALVLLISATDADVPSQTLTFELGSEAPAGAAIDPKTGSFSWKPTEAQGPSTNRITVKVTDNGSPPLSDSKTFTVIVRQQMVAPSITVPPQSQTVLAGVDVVFGAKAVGTPPLSYQWQFNRADLAGATDISLLLRSVQPAQAGNYRVVVGNAGGAATSAEALLTVVTPPKIIDPPTNQVVMVGMPATFRVVVTGTLPLNYQWRKGGANLTDGINLSGATSAALTIANAQASDAGSYDVIVTNLAGSATSPSALLTLILTPPGALAGIVTDALDGHLVAGVAVSAGGRSALTDAQGRYVLTELTDGVLKADFDADVTSGTAPLTVHFVNLSTTTALTLTGEKASYATYRNRQVKVVAGTTNQLNFSMSPVLTQGMRVVLNWGPVPKDLDLHLQIEGTTHHISFNDRNTPYGRLDHDVTDGWGPETLTVDQFYPGLYHYYVQHYDVFMPGSRLTNSAAQVHIYQEAEELKVVSVPTTGSGAFWHVCTVDGETGAITVINQITDNAALPGGVGGVGSGSSGGGESAGVQFLWDFGDGTTSTDESPVKVYGQAGSYTVSLRVDGEQGQSDVKVKPGFVTVVGGSAPRLGAQWVDGRAVLSVSGAVGKTYRIETTSVLGSAAVWQTVTTVTLGQPVQSWTDGQSGSVRTRYYRAVLAP